MLRQWQEEVRQKKWQTSVLLERRVAPMSLQDIAPKGCCVAADAKRPSRRRRRSEPSALRGKPRRVLSDKGRFVRM